MKKFLVPLLALVLAVGFSAFTSAKKVQKPSGASMYWYAVDQPSQKILAGTPLFAHTPRAQVQTDCADNGEEDCLRGFFNAQNTSADISDPGDEQIRVSDQ